MTSAPQTATDMAKSLWNDETVGLADVPQELRPAVEAALAARREKNAADCAAIADAYSVLQRAAIDAAARNGETRASLLPLDVGFDPAATGQVIVLPDCPGVLAVDIPAERLHASWREAYPHAIAIAGDVATIRSQYRSFVSETLRMAGYVVR